jgi:hypothetical protein
MRALIAASKRRDILLLLPVFWAAYFNQYSGSKYPLPRNNARNLTITRFPNLLLRSPSQMSNRLPNQLQWHNILLPSQHPSRLQTLAREEKIECLVSNASNHPFPPAFLIATQFLLRPFLAPASLVLRLGHPRKIYPQ